MQTVQFFKGNQLVYAERQEPKLEPKPHNKPTNSPFNMDELHWQGAGNSTQPANATQPQMPAVASSSSKNTATEVVKGIGVGVTALGVAAAAIAKQNSYSDNFVTYNGVTKTLTIKGSLKKEDYDSNDFLNLPLSEVKTIVIDQGVTNVDLSDAELSKLEKIIIPASVTRLTLPINCPALKEFEVDENNQNYYVENGVLFAKNERSEKLLVRFPSQKADSEYEVPEDIKTICSNAFSSCDQLEKITIKKDLALNDKAFNNCTNLTTVFFNCSISNNDSNKKAANAFSACNNNLKLYAQKINNGKIKKTFKIGGLPVVKGAPPQQQP